MCAALGKKKSNAGSLAVIVIKQRPLSERQKNYWLPLGVAPTKKAGRPAGLFFAAPLSLYYRKEATK